MPEDCTFQSTLPRGERLSPSGKSSKAVDVSIHAPAGGATYSNYRTGPGIKFQSTLPRGERRVLSAFRQFFSSFNPRSRGGSDLISSCRPSESSGFQSTLPRGERRGSTTATCWLSGFQSTLPRGERPCRWSVITSTGSFNPRSRGGSDWNTGSFPARTPEFQSTLPRGERLFLSRSDEGF